MLYLLLSLIGLIPVYAGFRLEIVSIIESNIQIKYPEYYVWAIKNDFDLVFDLKFQHLWTTNQVIKYIDKYNLITIKDNKGK